MLFYISFDGKVKVFLIDIIDFQRCLYIKVSVLEVAV